MCANDCKCGECSIPPCDIPDKVKTVKNFGRKLQRYLSKLRVVPVKMATIWKKVEVLIIEIEPNKYNIQS